MVRSYQRLRIMPPQLRLRNASSPNDKKEQYNNSNGNHGKSNGGGRPRDSSLTIPSSPRGESLLSSPSLHQALHPSSSDPGGSPSKRFQSSRRSSFSSSSSSTILFTHVLPLSKILKVKQLSTLFIICGTIFSIGSIYTLHTLATSSRSSSSYDENNYNINSARRIGCGVGDNDDGNRNTAPLLGGVRGKQQHASFNAPHFNYRRSNNNHHHQQQQQHNRRSDATASCKYTPRVFHMATESSIHDASKFMKPWWWGRRLYNKIFGTTSSILIDPMLHHDNWKPQSTYSSYFGKTEEYTSIGMIKEEDEEEEEEQPQCIPMSNWQTTSYPNCNTVHEIDLVRSSGSGSYTFPDNDYDDDDNKGRKERYGRRRRAITTYPNILHEHLSSILNSYPNPNRKKNAKSNARGIIKEESIEFLGQGWFRSAWEIYVESIPEYIYYDDDDDESEGVKVELGYEESVVLKTLRIERDFLEEYYELHRRDALSMERLTFSPYVLDIYGYCGQSAINELANFGIEGMSSLEKVARSFRGMDNVEPVSKIKLQLASMVAAGVSHMHSIDFPDFPQRYDSNDEPNPNFVEGQTIRSNATLVHYDLNPRNIAIVKRGKPKLNDFNVAEFLTWDRINNKTCGFQGRFREPWWRAPEEMQAHIPDKYPNPEPLTEKIDVYSLGNILWDILTTHSPRGKMTKERMDRVRPRVAKGELPLMEYEDFDVTKLETDPALMAIDKAMRKCLKVKPQDRPTAGEIADELSEALENLPEGYGDKEAWKRKMEEEEGVKITEKDSWPMQAKD